MSYTHEHYVYNVDYVASSVGWRVAAKTQADGWLRFVSMVAWFEW